VSEGVLTAPTIGAYCAFRNVQNNEWFKLLRCTSINVVIQRRTLKVTIYYTRV